MAEFLTQAEADNHYASKGMGNAGLALGIIGTTLASGILGPGGLFGGNGILGLGGNARGNIAGAAAVAGAEAAHEFSELSKREMLDQEYDLVQLGQVQINALKDQIHMRERDIAEKAGIYRQTKVDNNRIADEVTRLREYTTTGLADVYSASQKDFRNLERIVGENKLTSYKDMSDVYRASAIADKDLELRIERNREIDQHEKFGLYKDLQEKTSALAYNAMKQSYEDRLDTMEKMGALNARISALEKHEAVTSAQLPLMFRLSESDSRAAIQRAVCRKVDGTLMVGQDQIAVNPTSEVPCPLFSNNTGCC